MNGNLKKDLNRPYGTVASHETTYNHLNLPTLVRYATNRHIAYIYDATGAKLEKKVTDGTGNITITHYDGGYVYIGDILQYFPHSEGYVEVAPPAGSTYTDFKYIYQYKDHLGSTRLSYFKNANNQLEVVEESNYYAFGMKHTGYNNVVTSTNPAQKKLYNGKELQDELGLNWYDYQARNYDPILGRWFNIDPLAEKSRRWSPYNYCLNNPVYFIDPDGMEATPGGGGPGGATGHLSSLGADIAGVKTIMFGELGKKKTNATKSEAQAKLANAAAEFNDFVDNNPRFDSNNNISVKEEPLFQKRATKNSEIFALLDPSIKSKDRFVRARYEEANFEPNTILWFSHGDRNGVAGSMFVKDFDKYLYDNSALYKSAIDNGTPLTLKLFACITGDTGGLAQQLSDLRPNLTVWGPNNIISWPEPGNGKPYVGVDGNTLGHFNIYRGGSLFGTGNFTHETEK